MVIFRKMEIADIEEVSIIEKECFSVPWSCQDFIETLGLKYAYYMVAEGENGLIGVCGYRNICKEAEISNVSVRQSYRNKGIAFQMLNILLENGVKQGAEAFTLEVRENNKAAISLYRKLGFIEEGRRRNFYEKPSEDAIIMWKRN